MYKLIETNIGWLENVKVAVFWELTFAKTYSAVSPLCPSTNSFITFAFI